MKDATRARVLLVTALVLGGAVYWWRLTIQRESEVTPASGKAAEETEPSSLPESAQVDSTRESAAMTRSEVRVADISPPKPEPAPIENVKSWDELYADATLGQIIDERRRLQEVLESDPRAVAYYKAAWASGNFQVKLVAKDKDGGIKMPKEISASGDLTQVRVDTQSGEVSWASLPRNEFGDLYKTKEQIEWLSDREQLLKTAPIPAHNR